MQHTNVEKKTFTPRETRQGFKGKPVLVILVVSLFLAMAVWLAAEIWGESTAPATTETPPPPGPATSSQTVNPGAQSSQTFDNNPPSGATPPTEGVDRNPSTQAP